MPRTATRLASRATRRMSAVAVRIRPLILTFLHVPVGPSALGRHFLFGPCVAVPRRGQVRVPAPEGAEEQRHALAVAGGHAAREVLLAKPDGLATNAAHLEAVCVRHGL